MFNALKDQALQIDTKIKTLRKQCTTFAIGYVEKDESKQYPVRKAIATARNDLRDCANDCDSLVTQTDTLFSLLTVADKAADEIYDSVIKLYHEQGVKVPPIELETIPVGIPIHLLPVPEPEAANRTPEEPKVEERAQEDGISESECDSEGSLPEIFITRPPGEAGLEPETPMIKSRKRRILLDTGDANVKEYIGHLRKVLMDERVLINDIIISHWHHDHVGGVDDILEVIDNKGTGNDTCNVWKFPRTDAPEPEVRNTTLKELKDGQIFNTDGATLKVIHTPGHTTDHVVLVMQEDNALFSADCILGEGTTVFEDLYLYMKSLETILNAKPTVIYPGHGNIIDDPTERVTEYINHRNHREKQIFAVFEENPDKQYNEMDIVRTVYKETPEQLWAAAAYNVNHHLKKLTVEGKLLECVDSEGGNSWKYVKPASL
uniref:Lactamase_B domain-containing protein n=1 Tax=Anopheles minimus TaxID=112268 RepID=A0A182W1A4_9DIPT